jgi:dCTP deaminase
MMARSSVPSGGTLSDFEILYRLVRDDPKCIFVSPLVDPVKQLGPSSLDVRLDAQIRIPTQTRIAGIDLTLSREDIDRQSRRYFVERRVDPLEGFSLHPGDFVLGSTLEYIRLPDDVAARLDGRSSIGRLGIKVHATAGFVHPGYEGTLTFELSNAGRVPVTLRPGDRIAQLTFVHVAGVQVPYSGKYARMAGTGLSRFAEDRA